jgi:hypothetical protein
MPPSTFLPVPVDRKIMRNRLNPSARLMFAAIINPDERTHKVNAFGAPIRRVGIYNMLPGAAWTPACIRELLEVSEQ